MGYLVCDKCKGYYKLEPDESPEDFEEECECGGKLEVVYNLSNVFEEVYCPQCGYKNSGITLFCQECGAYLKMEGKSLMMDSSK